MYEDLDATYLHHREAEMGCSQHRSQGVPTVTPPNPTQQCIQIAKEKLPQATCGIALQQP
jgi:hypothetical protein